MFFGRSPAWDSVSYWALDLETSGLEAKTDEILSVGMVPIRAGTIRWGERYYRLVRPRDPAKLSSAGIAAHHLLPAEVASAPAPQTVLPEIRERLAEGYLLLHFSTIDLVFLRRAFRELGLAWPHPTVIDTVELLGRLDERRQYLESHPEPLPTGLSDARARLGLPPHDQHHALGDALATAELFLALRARLDARTVRELK